MLLHPPYLPGLVPSDLHKFDHLKDSLQSHCKTNDETLQNSILLAAEGGDQLYLVRIHAVVHKWNSNVGRDGGYHENGLCLQQRHSEVFISLWLTLVYVRFPFGL